MENGRTALVVEDIESWLDRVDADAATRSELLAQAREIGTRVRPWRDADRSDTATQQAIRGRRDADAASIAVYQSEVVPGVLQTPDYARRLLEVHSLVTPESIPATVLARMDRQTALFDESKQFDLVITETALRWRPGSEAVQLAQLDRIASFAAFSNIRIGVISRETQELPEACPLHSFVIRRHTDEPASVEIETLTAEQEVTEPADVALFDQFFAHQLELAEQGPELLVLLDRIRGDLRKAATT